MTTVSPEEAASGDARVRMTGASHEGSTFTQVAGDQYSIHLPPAPPSPLPAMCTLPVDTAAFTGRGKELHRIMTAVTAAAQAGQVVAIHAIDGMAGVGKTALAVHVAHRVAVRFPDRQLFLDLHAHTAGRQPTTPEAALASLLTADGVGARYLPKGLDARAALWRDRMARKRVLLVLDNAASSGQVVPLLPGSAGCLVLVTSRRYLGDLPSAVPVPLDILPPEDARRMFLRLTPRAAAEPARVAELVALCGHLPLAIALLASLFSTCRSWTLGQLIEETKTTLLTVAAENRTVAAAFDLSYQHLPAERRRFFRQLGLHPGVDIDAFAAAALTGLPLDQASQHFDVLCRDHLLDEPVYRRYRMHDLIRDYARALAATDPVGERDRALGWLLDYYQHTAAFADAYLTRLTRLPAITSVAPTGAAVPELASRDQALDWLRVERANLLACLDHAAHHAQHARVAGLTAGVVSLLRREGPWIQAWELHAQAATTARHVGDRLGEANALIELGDVRRLTGDYPGAAQALERALSLCRDLGDRLGEAHALIELGGVRRLTGHYPGAVQMLEQALSLYRDLGDQHGEAEVLNQRGTVCLKSGDAEQALAHHQRALDLARAVGIPLEQARALGGVGRCALARGDTATAATQLRQALEIYQRLGAAEATKLATDLAELHTPIRPMPST